MKKYMINGVSKKSTGQAYWVYDSVKDALVDNSADLPLKIYEVTFKDLGFYKIEPTIVSCEAPKKEAK